MAPPQAATSLTGAKTDRPLDIANERAAAAPVAKKGSGPEFLKFLRDIVGESQELTLLKNLHAGEGLDSYRAFDAYLQKFAPFSKRKGGGYQIPHSMSASAQYIDDLTRAFTDFKLPEGMTVENLDQFLGFEWTKAEVIFSGGLKKSSTNDNHNLFTKAKKLNTDAGEYVKRGRLNEDDPHVRELEAQFDDMEYGTFKALLEGELEELEDTRPGPSKRKRTKRKHTHDSSDSDDDEERKKREKRAKLLEKEAKKLREKGRKSKSSKGKEKTVDSDHLDSDDST